MISGTLSSAYEIASARCSSKHSRIARFREARDRGVQHDAANLLRHLRDLEQPALFLLDEAARLGYMRIIADTAIEIRGPGKLDDEVFPRASLRADDR